MPRFRGAIFDVDGVLVDSPHEKAWRESLRELMESDWQDIRDQTTWSPDAFAPRVYEQYVSGQAAHERRLGRALAQRLLGDGELVLDVPSWRRGCGSIRRGMAARPTPMMRPRSAWAALNSTGVAAVRRSCVPPRLAIRDAGGRGLVR